MHEKKWDFKTASVLLRFRRLSRDAVFSFSLVPMRRPAYTENTSKWGRFEEASAYMGLARNQNLIKIACFSKYPEF